MKYQILIDKNHEEEVLIYAHEKTQFICDLEAYLSGSAPKLIGYTDDGIATVLSAEGIFCVYVEQDRVYALMEKQTYRIKERLYAAEEYLGDGFVKINQSCLVNLKKIQKFETTVGGSLMVTLQNGYRDYISRRQLKAVKERMGIR